MQHHCTFCLGFYRQCCCQSCRSDRTCSICCRRISSRHLTLPFSLRRRVRCASGNRTEIQGYTPASYITYSSRPQDACSLSVDVTVDAPASVCYDIFNDWHRLVDFFDLVHQIGLDPGAPDMAMFQCFYRWGTLPGYSLPFCLISIFALGCELGVSAAYYDVINPAHWNITVRPGRTVPAWLC